MSLMLQNEANNKSQKRSSSTPMVNQWYFMLSLRAVSLVVENPNLLVQPRRGKQLTATYYPNLKIMHRICFSVLNQSIRLPPRKNKCTVLQRAQLLIRLVFVVIIPLFLEENDIMSADKNKKNMITPLSFSRMKVSSVFLV